MSSLRLARGGHIKPSLAHSGPQPRQLCFKAASVFFSDGADRKADESAPHQSSSIWAHPLPSWAPPLVSAAAAFMVLTSPLQALANDVLSPDTPVYDGVKLIATEKRAELSQQLTAFEKETGWRLRLYTTSGPDARPAEGALRSAWQPDKRTVVINFDASNPNLVNFVYLGDEVLAKLRRPWFYELQGRFGNIFYIKEEGEQAAVLNTMAALRQCLGAEEGCKVVPGLTSDQYGFTLALSVAGGIIAGSVSRLEVSGRVTASWQWLLIFSPLWASLFINFGLGPVVSRTSDLTPVLGNTAAFALAAASPYLIEALLRQPAPPPNSEQ